MVPSRFFLRQAEKDHGLVDEDAALGLLCRHVVLLSPHAKSGQERTHQKIRSFF